MEEGGGEAGEGLPEVDGAVVRYLPYGRFNANESIIHWSGRTFRSIDAIANATNH